MPAISNRGTILPGGVASFDLAPAGKGLGCGASGSAKRVREAGVMSPAFGLASPFAAVAAPAPSPFCWAHKGNAKRALTATAAHQVRIILLPQFSRLEPKPFLSLLQARRWRRRPLVGASLVKHPLNFR